MGNIGFGDTVVSVPSGRTSFSTRIDETASDGLYVDVTANFNVATGVVIWTFTSIDPTTLDIPAEPLAGFLPPDDDSGQGQGFVAYTVRPKIIVTTGARIEAQASVVFDTNAAIATHSILNTIDDGEPTSQVEALPPTIAGTSFVVSWSGNDEAGVGSGIATFDVFVSDNGAPYTAFQSATTNTSATFNGQIGHTYSFYSVAMDNVGHIEASHTSADTTTLLVQQRTISPGDYNQDGIVTDDDYTVWRSSIGQTGTGLAADGNHDGVVDALDYLIWRENAFHVVHDSAGDYNHDNVIDQLDYQLWRSEFGQVGLNLPADGNHDGLVDARDFLIWKAHDRSLVILLTFAPGDYNHDGVVSDADYQVWRSTFGQTGSGLAADGNHNGVVDTGDYVVWRENKAQTASAAGASAGAVALISDAASPAQIQTLLSGQNDSTPIHGNIIPANYGESTIVASDSQNTDLRSTNWVAASFDLAGSHTNVDEAIDAFENGHRSRVSNNAVEKVSEPEAPHFDRLNLARVRSFSESKTSSFALLGYLNDGRDFAFPLKSALSYEDLYQAGTQDIESTSFETLDDAFAELLDVNLH